MQLFEMIHLKLFLGEDGYTEQLNGHCSEHMGAYVQDVEEAKQQCRVDKNCIAIEDVECGGNIYYKCSGTVENSTKSCVFTKGKDLITSILSLKTFNRTTL